MPRLRYTLAQAEAEALRLAQEYVSQQSWAGEVWELWVTANRYAAKSPSTKFPVIWYAIIKFPPPPGGIMDGGDLSLDVNIETKEVRPSWP